MARKTPAKGRSSRRATRWCGLLSLLIALAVSGCGKGEKSAKACDALASSQQGLTPRLQDLEALAGQLPEKLGEKPELVEATLHRYAELVEEISSALDEQHNNYERACKWPYLDEGDYDGVHERVYGPYIENTSRMILATEALAATLAQRGPEDVIKDAEQELRRVARQMKRALLEQVHVCEADFDEETCDAFVNAVNDALKGQ